MLCAEIEGVREMYETNTIRVPRPICCGKVEKPVPQFSYAVFEHLSMRGRHGKKTQEEFGKNLARMHRHTSPDGQFGWKRENTIGLTPQVTDLAPGQICQCMHICVTGMMVLYWGPSR